LEQLDPKVLSVFLNKTWIHFGETKEHDLTHGGGSGYSITDIFKKYSLSYIVKRSFARVFGKKQSKLSDKQANELYQQTNFEGFNYKKGDKLPFDDNSINFIYSEHFFEHLFLDEASALLKECYRILTPHGVIRTCVPDADLRTYLPPEPVGFPDTKLAFDHPSKHKTRWSVYSFEEVLKFNGYKPVSLYYCDKFGKHFSIDPIEVKQQYEGSTDQEMILSLSCVQRLNSLIIDGVKTL